MKVEDIRDGVQRMRLTTPEAELLGCIALTLAEILESVMEILESVNLAADTADELTSHRPMQCSAAEAPAPATS